MTNVARPPKLPPAWFKHFFWRAHRALHRISGGRFLWSPASKRRWGAAGLTTTGRKSGRDRTVIIGYIAAEDVEGKVALKPIARDTIVKTTDVVPEQWIAGRSVLDVQVVASSGAPGPGEHAMLVVSPKIKGFDGFVLDDVVVVAVIEADESATYTIALCPGDLGRLAPVLAVAELRFAPPTNT